MKFYFTSLLLVCTLGLPAQSMQEVEQYFVFFNNQHIAVNNLAMNYLQYSVHSTDFGLIENKRQEVIAQLNTSIEAVENINPLQTDDQLKPAALEVFRSFLASFSIDFAQLIQLKAASQTSYEAMESYFEAQQEAGKKMDATANRYLEAQKGFAEKHNILLQQAEENADIQNLNRLNNYHQAIFMKYFKVLSRNNEFLNAMNSQDAAAITKARLQLEKDSETELKILNAMPAYEEDSEYKNSAIELVKKINDLSKIDYQALEDIAKKSATERTQEDVNTFNASMQNIQTIIPPLNTAVTQKGSELLKKFIPKPRMTQRL